MTVLSVAPAPAASIYHWIDADGVGHYTADPRTIPPAQRPRARVIAAPSARPASAPAPPPAIALPGSAPIVTDAMLNGVPLTLLLDTGAARTMISPSAIARAGIETSDGRIVRVVGITGTADALELTIPRLDIVGARIGPLRVVAFDVAVAGVDGLLGRDLFEHFTLTVDPVEGRAVLLPR